MAIARTQRIFLMLLGTYRPGPGLGSTRDSSCSRSSPQPRAQSACSLSSSAVFPSGPLICHLSVEFLLLNPFLAL